MSAIVIKCVMLLLFLSFSALFSCSETAFFSLGRAELSALKLSKKWYAKQVIGLLKNPREVLVTILLGNELVNVAFAVTVASIVYDVAGHVSWKISTLVSIFIATPLILLFGEVLPKNIAVRFASVLSPILVYPIRFFYQLVFPFRFLLSRFADQMILIFGGDPKQVRSMVMEEEFRQLVELGYKEGALEEGESELIHRIFELGNKTVKEIMTPAALMFSLPMEMPLEKMVEEVKATQYNRIPVYRCRPDNIIGAIHSRDVFKLYRNRQRGYVVELDEIVRPVHFVESGASIEDVLSDMQGLKVHIAIVLDKKEGVVGLVTMDDVFGFLFTQKLERK